MSRLKGKERKGSWRKVNSLVLLQEHLRHLAAWQTGNLAGLGSDLATGNLAEMDHIDGFLWKNLRA